MKRVQLFMTLILVSFFVFMAAAQAKATVVVLDPGHGGSDTGAVYNDLQEKNVNLDIAYRTKTLLENRGYTVYLTRTYEDEDNYIYKSNWDRYTFANSAPGAAAMISIHLNASSDHSIDGTQGFYGKKLKDEAFTRTVHQSLKNSLGVTDRGVRNFPSGVLLKSKMPATLQETVFLTSNYEYALLSDGTGKRQQEIAQALFEGIDNWFNK